MLANRLELGHGYYCYALTSQEGSSRFTKVAYWDEQLHYHVISHRTGPIQLLEAQMSDWSSVSLLHNPPTSATTSIKYYYIGLTEVSELIHCDNIHALVLGRYIDLMHVE